MPPNRQAGPLVKEGKAVQRRSKLKAALREAPRTWLVTGVAGFIGSNLLEALLELDQRVVGLDNFSTGKRANLDEVCSLVTSAQWTRFRFFEGDVCDLETCRKVTEGVDYVLHHAALGSVPRSLADPVASHASNVSGTLNMLLAAHENRVQRFVYASSSSVYGDHPDLPKREDNTGHCLSPYAATKAACELYAEVFARCYGLETIGLRYFNVFGPRQDPNGPYAAVIPRWIAAMLHGAPVVINGDGQTSRDFCYVANVVQANLLAATAPKPFAPEPAPRAAVFNIAVGERTSLNGLFHLLKSLLEPCCPHLADCVPLYREFRLGDVRHSNADISRARHALGYEPTHDICAGLSEALGWYEREVVRSHHRFKAGTCPGTRS